MLIKQSCIMVSAIVCFAKTYVVKDISITLSRSPQYVHQIVRDYIDSQRNSLSAIY